VEVDIMMKPICVPCQRFYKPVKNDFYFIEGMPHGENVQPGTAEPEKWKPYKLWAGDKWKCEGCNAEIVVGVAYRPIDEHYTPTFEKNVKLHNAEFQVNDC
jgi:hypothetical protein